MLYIWILAAISHLNAAVRKCTAQHLANLVEKVGAARLLSGGKELTDRIDLACSCKTLTRLLTRSQVCYLFIDKTYVTIIN